MLAHMNTARWGSMNTADREEAIQCPCQCGIQNVEHVLTGECEYILVYLDEMIETVDCVLCSETEAAQSRWMAAQNVEEKVGAIVGMETRGVSADALGEAASALKLLVRRSKVAHTRFQCRLVRFPRINRDNQEQKRSKITILDSKYNP